MKPLTLAGGRRVLAAMQISIDDGTIGVLGVMLAQLGPKLEALRDASCSAKLKDIRQSYTSSQAIEQRYGVGCLLDLDRRSVREKIKKGWIPLDLVRNAETYGAELNSHSRTCSVSTRR
jgi:hypothetical protein